MEYLIPLGILVVVVALAFLIAIPMIRAPKRPDFGDESANRKNQTKQQSPKRRKLSDRVSLEAAMEASSRLDQKTHREVYRKIAAGRATEAAVLYREATGKGAMDAMFDVQALAAYPQEWTAVAKKKRESAHQMPQAQQKTDLPKPEAPKEDISTGVDSGQMDLTNLTVPTEWTQAKPVQDQPFQAEVIRDDITVRLSSDDLPEWLRDQIFAMVRDAKVEDAAELLAENSVLNVHEALDLLKVIAEEQNRPDE